MKAFTLEEVLDVINDLKNTIIDNCRPSQGDYDYGEKCGYQDDILEDFDKVVNNLLKD